MGDPFSVAQRLSKLPPYLFAEIDRMKQEAIRRGMDIINLGIGDPDLPTPPHIVKRMQEASADPRHHQYPSYEGMLSFRQAVADWYDKRFGVALDPETEVLSLIGSKEGIGHLPLAFVDSGDIVLVPDPGYPVYQAGTVLADGIPYFMPLTRERAFLPDLEAIPSEVLKKARILFLNYPNNPTAAVAPRAFFVEAVAFARKHQLILCHDAAYSEMAYDGYLPESILAVEGAKDVAIEYHSLSKTYNMTGWRIGFAVGCRKVLSGLGRIKTNLDSGVFQAVQEAAITALSGPQECIEAMRAVYRERRDTLVDGLSALGFAVEKPKATFYVWISVPKGQTSASFASALLSDVGIVMTPGTGFGQHGEGYIRAALTVDVSRIKEAVERIAASNLTPQ
ncbi:LL-diaminopimelate aminotransferase [Candidatus Methylomirabilis limnetica]|jgi:LL-diaminopimelate aminotransferase|uniref:Aminotransferase n=1 Tax=Candidatus Methylomirabilis limnetica TaxID=2033718 RepID=A0A2T4TZ49_9BACT|nr:LL-diaminopimelate aminotransferase [Candidatus Methylomirabilis limnetica]PTL36409.1 LL-diaminopimelate aminotransferase [Candidatus Methylomirabilis limnetica]